MFEKRFEAPRRSGSPTTFEFWRIDWRQRQLAWAVTGPLLLPHSPSRRRLGSPIGNQRARPSRLSKSRLAAREVTRVDLPWRRPSLLVQRRWTE